LRPGHALERRGALGVVADRRQEAAGALIAPRADRADPPGTGVENRHALDQRLDAGAARPDDAGLRAVEVLLERDARIVVAGMRADDDRQLEDVADLARDLVMPARRRGAARRADAALRADEDLAAVVAPGLDLDPSCGKRGASPGRGRGQAPRPLWSPSASA
jgi:hypothetical protein